MSYETRTAMRAMSYVQTSASDTWTITHNMNGKVVVDVAVNLTGYSLPVKIIPNEIDCSNNNQVKITFSAPHTGFARIAG